jgi:hypothetical protein
MDRRVGGDDRHTTFNLHDLDANNLPEAVTTLQNPRQDAVSHIQLGASPAGLTVAPGGLC